MSFLLIVNLTYFKVATKLYESNPKTSSTQSGDICHRKQISQNEQRLG